MEDILRLIDIFKKKDEVPAALTLAKDEMNTLKEILGEKHEATERLQSECDLLRAMGQK